MRETPSLYGADRKLEREILNCWVKLKERSIVPRPWRPRGHSERCTPLHWRGERLNIGDEAETLTFADLSLKEPPALSKRVECMELACSLIWSVEERKLEPFSSLWDALESALIEGEIELSKDHSSPIHREIEELRALNLHWIADW